MYNAELFTVEVVSVIACVILVKFMIKPFRFTGETRYLGLPLGFGFLGLSYAVSALTILGFLDFPFKWWFQLFMRAFAFLFLATTYYFSNVNRKKNLLRMYLGILIVTLIFLIFLAIISPQTLGPNYLISQIYVRIFNLLCLFFIIILIIKRQLEEPSPTTLIVFGFIFLAIAQYLQIIWVVDQSVLSFRTGFFSRLVALIILLYVSFKTYFKTKREVN